MIKKALLLSTLIATATLSQAHAAEAPTAKDFNKVYGKFQELSQKGQWKASEKQAQKAYEIGKSLFGENSKNTAALAHNHGVALLKLKKRDKAKTVLLEAVELHENVYGKDDEKLVTVLIDLAASLNRGSDVEQKNTALKRALKITEKVHGKGSAHWGQRSVEIGVKMLGKATLKQSRNLIKQGYEALNQQLGKDTTRVHYAALQLGKVDLALGNNKSAANYLQLAVTGATASSTPSQTIELAARELSVQALERLGKRDDATAHLLALAQLKANGAPITAKAVVKSFPVYPKAALDRNQGGFVHVQYDIDEEGFVTNIQVIDSKGPSQLKKSAIEAAEKFRYLPYLKDGKPTVVKDVKNRFTFDLGKKKVTMS